MFVSLMSLQKNLESFSSFDVLRHHFVEGKQPQIFLLFVSLGSKSI